MPARPLSDFLNCSTKEIATETVFTYEQLIESRRDLANVEIARSHAYWEAWEKYPPETGVTLRTKAAEKAGATLDRDRIDIESIVEALHLRVNALRLIADAIRVMDEENG